MDVPSAESEEREDEPVPTPRQAQHATSEEEDAFMSCQVNISITKTLTEESKLYKATVNKEYVACGPLINKNTVSASGEQCDEDLSNTAVSSTEAKINHATCENLNIVMKDNHIDIVPKLAEGDQREDGLTKDLPVSPANKEFCIVDAISLKNPVVIKEEPGDVDGKLEPYNKGKEVSESNLETLLQDGNTEFSIADVVSLKEETGYDNDDVTVLSESSTVQSLNSSDPFGAENGAMMESGIDILAPGSIDILDCDGDYHHGSQSELHVEYESGPSTSEPSSLFTKVSAVTPSSFVLDQHYDASDRLRIKRMLLDMEKLRNKPTPQAQRKQQLDALLGTGDDSFDEIDNFDTSIPATTTSEVNNLLPQSCPNCGRNFMNTVNLDRHERVCGKHICHQCDRTFLKRAYLLKHKHRGTCVSSLPLTEIKVEPDTTHLSEYDNGCGLYNGADLEITPIIKPSTEEVRMFGSPNHKPYHCHLCGRGFSKNLSLQTHLQNHDSYRHSCDICHQLFAKGAYVRSHKKLAHGIEVKSKKTINSNVLSTRPALPNTNAVIQKQKYTCKHCNRVYSHEENFKAHLKLHAVPKRFVCNRCGRRFAKNGALQTHLRNHDEFMHHCSICQQVFARTRDLNAHMMLDHDMPPKNQKTTSKETVPDEPVEDRSEQVRSFSCKICSSSFSEEGNLRLHEKLHLTDQKFLCEKCGRSFSQQKYLRAHLRNHDQYQYCCTICKQMFGTVQYLGRHMKIEHAGQTKDDTTALKGMESQNNTTQSENTDEGINVVDADDKSTDVVGKVVDDEESPVEQDPDTTPAKCIIVDGKTRHCCRFCDRQYSTKWNLSVHERLHVPLGKPFKCERCGRRFNEKSSLDIHLLKHDSYKHKCTICSQVFGKPNFLQSHMSTAHNGRKKPTAPLEIKTNSTVESPKMESRTIELTNPKKGGRFVCQQCNKSYSTAHSLKAHEVLHSLPKPHSCEVCGRKFVKSDSLRKHLLYHDIYTDVCEVCGQVFGSAAFLRKHKEQEHDGTETNEVVNTKFRKTVNGRKQQEHPDEAKKTESEKTIGTIVPDPLTSSEKQEPMPLVCPKCNKTFQRHGNMVIHMKMCSPDRFQCIKCGRKFKKMGILQAHLQNHDSMKHKCPKCGQMFFRGNFLHIHMEEEHGVVAKEDEDKNAPAKVHLNTPPVNKRPKGQVEGTGKTANELVCKKCKKKFQRLCNLNFHIKLCGSDHLKCKKCGRKFKKLSVLQSHMKNHDSMKHRCPICSQMFFRSTFLEWHMLEEHKDDDKKMQSAEDGKDSSFTCDKCNKVFSRMGNLKFHRKICAPEKYDCRKCGRRFKEMKVLSNHLRNHNAMKHKCELCTAVFFRPSLLKIHMKDDHGSIRPLSKVVRSGGTSQRQALLRKTAATLPYKCSLCTRAYASHDSLQQHLKWHERSDKIHKCETCGKVFQHHTSLMKHLVNHRRYQHQCDICNQVFPRESFLKRHQETDHPDIFSTQKEPEASSQNTDVSSESVEECEIISDAAATPEAPSSEKSSCTVGNFSCRYCSTALESESSVRAHEDECNLKGKHLCHKCGRVYTHAAMLEKHLKNHHEYKHYCDVCNQVFTRVFHVEKHKRTRHPEYYISKPSAKCNKRNKSTVENQASPVPVAKHREALAKKQLRRAHITKKFFRLRSRLLPALANKPGSSRSLPTIPNPSDTSAASSKVYPCAKCCKIFRHRMSLRRHLKKHHCDLCEEVFENSRELLKHKSNNHKQRSGKNHVAEKKSKDVDDIDVDKGSGNDTGGETTEVDDITEDGSEKETEKMGDSMGLEKEEKPEDSTEEVPVAVTETVVNGGTGPRFRCGTCYTTFGHKKNLRSHQKTAVKTQCSFCPRYFCHARPLLIHEKKCEKETKLEKSKKEMKKTGNDSQVQQNYVNKNEDEVTPSRKSPDHVNSTMNNHKPKEVIEIDELDMNTPSLPPISPLPNSHLSKSRNQAYECDGCSKVFDSYRDMAAHRLTHSGKRPVQCDWCQATFTRKDSLETKHQKVAVRQQCETCGMRFCLPQRYRFHVKKHELELEKSNNILYAEADEGFESSMTPMETVNLEEEENDEEQTYQNGPQNLVSLDLQESNNHFTDVTSNKEDLDTCSVVTSNGQTPVMDDIEGMMTINNSLLSPGNTPTETRDLSMCRVLVPSTKSFTETLVKWKCPECDVLVGKRASLVNHLKTHSNLKPFKCSWCSWNFRRKDSLTGHLKNGNQQKCGICGEQFCREKYFIIHLRKHERGEFNDAPGGVADEYEGLQDEGMAEYDDDSQDEIDDDEDSAVDVDAEEEEEEDVDDLEKEEEEEEVGEKEEAGKDEVSSPTLKRRKRSMVPDPVVDKSDYRPYKCELCPKTYILRHHLKRHLDAEHSDKEHVENHTVTNENNIPSEPNWRDIRSQQRQQRQQQQLQQQSQNEKAVKEDSEQDESQNATKLQTAKRSHPSTRSSRSSTTPQPEPNVYKCDICFKVLASRSSLSKHIVVMHTGKREHKCHVCGKDFQFPSDVQAHLRNVHRDDSPFICHICNTRFKRPDSLKYHMKRQHDGQPVETQPESCGDSDNADEDIEVHNGIAGEKEDQQSCNDCNENFSTDSDFQAHIAFHESVKHPGNCYTCDRCGKIFGLRTAFLNHRKKHIAQDLDIALPQNCGVIIEPLPSQSDSDISSAE